MATRGRNEGKAEVLRALAHPTRLRVLEALETAGALSPVDYVTAGHQASLGTVSHHFRTLRDAGLIEVASTEQRRGALKSSYRLTRRGRQVNAVVKGL